MFTMKIIRKPWRGEEVKARLRAQSLEAARRCAEFMAERARMYAPVDTGFLKANIVVIATQGGTLYRVVSMAHYSAFQEWGFMAHGTWVPGRAFMRRALADAKREFPALLAAARVSAPTETTHLGTTFTV